MKFSFDNISGGDKSICCPNETGDRLRDVCLCVCKANDELYLWGNISS